MFANNEEIKAATVTVGAQLAARIRTAAPSRSIAALLQGTAIALSALLLAPNAALAAPGGQCGAQTTDGDPNTSDTIVCDPEESYPDGISYSSDGGDLLLNEQAVLDGKDIVLMDVQDGGLNVTGGDDDIEFFADQTTNSDGKTLRAGVTGSAGAVIDYRSASGGIAITTGPVVATGDASHAIRAESTAGGDIAILAEPLGNNSFIAPQGLRSPGTGIFAKTIGAGTVDIATVEGFRSLGDDDIHTGGTGIEAITADGALTIATEHRITAGGTGIDATSLGGDISIDAGDDIDSDTGTDTGISATSAGGDIAISAKRVTGFDTGIAAVGGGAVTLTTNGIVGGDMRAVLADAGGALAVTLDKFVRLRDPGAPGDLAAVEAISGGPLSLEVTSNVSGSIRVDAGGDALIDLLNANRTRSSEAADRPALDLTAATAATVNNAGTLRTGVGDSRENIPNGDSGFTYSVFTHTEAGNVVLRAAGAGDIAVHNDGLLYGRIDGAGLSGDFTLVNGDGLGWRVNGDNALGDGDVTVDNQGTIYTGLLRHEVADLFVFSDTPIPPPELTPENLVTTTIDFGGGSNRFDNAGVLVVGFGASSNLNPTPGAQLVEQEAALTAFTGLDRFDNSGTIVLGGQSGTAPLVQRDLFSLDFDSFDLGVLRSPIDGAVNDVLSLPGVAFTGSGDSTILLDAALSLGRPQADCQTRDADNTLPGADCVDLRGGSTDGDTVIRVHDPFSGDRGAYNPDGIVVVDVAGGSSAADDFSLSPESHNYRLTQAGVGVIDKGLFVYPLVYDPAAQQHKLLGLPSRQARRLPLLVESAQGLTRDAVVATAGRARELREALRDGAPGGGTWGRVTGATADRDVREDGGALGEIDNSFQQDRYGVNLGVDRVFGAGGERAFFAGGSIGYGRADLRFDRGPATADFDGPNLGVYGGYVAGAFHVDAVVQGALLKTDYRDVSLTLSPMPVQDPNDPNTIFSLQDKGDLLSTDANMLAAHVEAGRRFALTPALHVEPLAALSWVRADFDAEELNSFNPRRPGNTVFGKNTPNSLRAGLGGRLDFKQALSKLRLSYTVTARLWEELDGETDVTIQSAGPDATVTDDFDGSFGEVRAGVDLTSPGGAVDGYLHATGMFGDDYDSAGGELGFRYQW